MNKVITVVNFVVLIIANSKIRTCMTFIRLRNASILQVVGFVSKAWKYLNFSNITLKNVHISINSNIAKTVFKLYSSKMKKAIIKYAIKNYKLNVLFVMKN
jgi:hypothetical protein